MPIEHRLNESSGVCRRQEETTKRRRVSPMRIGECLHTRKKTRHGVCRHSNERRIRRVSLPGKIRVSDRFEVNEASVCRSEARREGSVGRIGWRVSPCKEEKKSPCVGLNWIVCRSVCVTKFKPTEQAVNKVQECH